MAEIMHTRHHGENNLKVSVFGLGCMEMCFGYGDPKNQKQIFKQIRTAFDSAEVLDPF
jgi:aryl-alcohol dehydrogenase-like predicted oxidoreductase